MHFNVFVMRCNYFKYKIFKCEIIKNKLEIVLQKTRTEVTITPVTTSNSCSSKNSSDVVLVVSMRAHLIFN